MTKTRKVKFTIMILSMLLLINPLKTFSQENEEENQLIQAETIAPQNLNNLKDRTYDEGITVKEIEIKGNNLVKAGDILGKLETKQGSKFDKDAVQRDLKTIYDMGYFTDKLKAVPEASSTGIKLRIEVEENVPVTGFNITGNKVVSTEDLSKIFNSQTGLPQNIAELNKATEKIEQLYADKGYVLARVKKITDDPDGMINIEINEGVIDDIKISGNTKTKDFVVKRNMVTASGMVYNENVLKQDLSRIFATQSFSDIRRVISASPKDPEKYQLTVEVDEKRTGSISLGGGVDTGTGLFGTVGYMDHNFRGLGQQVSANFMAGSGVILPSNNVVSRAAFQFEANFVEPRLKQTLNSLEVSAYGRDYGSYQVPLGIERRIGSSIQIGRPIKKVPHLAGSFSLGAENVSLREGDYDKYTENYEKYVKKNASDKTMKRARNEMLEGGTFISLGPSLVYDTRNSVINPTDGWLASASLKESFAIGGDVGTFGKASVTAKKYFPVGQKSSFSIMGRAGSQLVSTLPEFAAFRLGGYDTIRGYREGDIGNGQSFMLASAEYTTPIPFINKITNINFFKDMRLAGFFDAGTLFRETRSTAIFGRPGYGISAGMGLRVNIPGLGPIKVDYGYPLSFVGKGGRKSGQFTFGFGDRY